MFLLSSLFNMSKNFLSIIQLSLTSRHRDNFGIEPNSIHNNKLLLHGHQALSLKAFLFFPLVFFLLFLYSYFSNQSIY